MYTRSRPAWYTSSAACAASSGSSPTAATVPCAMTPAAQHSDRLCMTVTGAQGRRQGQATAVCLAGQCPGGSGWQDTARPKCDIQLQSAMHSSRRPPPGPPLAAWPPVSGSHQGCAPAGWWLAGPAPPGQASTAPPPLQTLQPSMRLLQKAALG